MLHFNEEDSQPEYNMLVKCVQSQCCQCATQYAELRGLVVNVKTNMETNQFDLSQNETCLQG